MILYQGLVGIRGAVQNSAGGRFPAWSIVWVRLQFVQHQGGILEQSPRFGVVMAAFTASFGPD